MNIVGQGILTNLLILYNNRFRIGNEISLRTAMVVANFNLGIVLGVRFAELETHDGAILVDLRRESRSLKSDLQNDVVLHNY